MRLLWAPHQVADGTSILHYGPSGISHHVRIPSFTDPHDVFWDGDHYVAVSAFQDCVFWITPEGEVVRSFEAAGGGDCWHLNCLAMHEGILYATAFGRFDQPRGWAGRQLEGTGMLFRMDTGEDVLSGLHCPHSPRRVAGQWILCNSFTSELAAYADGDREPVRRLKLRDWLRGLTFSDDYLLVGESVNRQLTAEVRGAAVAILDRKSWELLGRISLPYREVYELVLVSSGLLKCLLQAPHPRELVSCPAEILRDGPEQARGSALRRWLRRITRA